MDINVLIIDEHSLLSKNYKEAFSILKKEFHNIDFKVNMTQSCDKALKKIKETSPKEPIHIILMDVKLPRPKEVKKPTFDCQNAGKIIRRLMKGVKIIVLTNYSKNYMIKDILKNISPHSLLIKEDFSITDFTKSITSVINNASYYSQTAIKILVTNMLSDIPTDSKDHMILQELSWGTKMKDLPNVVDMSLAGIEKRKRRLKHALNIPDESDLVLLQKIKEKRIL